MHALKFPLVVIKGPSLHHLLKKVRQVDVHQLRVSTSLLLLNLYQTQLIRLIEIPPYARGWIEEVVIA